MSEKCSAECVCRGLRFPRWYPCDSPAKVTRDGKHYCLRHDPVKIKASRDARLAIANAKWENKQKMFDRAHACRVACEGMVHPVAEVKAMRELLQKLLTLFYEDEGELHWGYNEGHSVGNVSGDKEFEQQLIKRKNEMETNTGK